MTKNELVKAMDGIDGEAWIDVMFPNDPNAYAITGAEQFELSWFGRPLGPPRALRLARAPRAGCRRPRRGWQAGPTDHGATTTR